MAILPIKQQDGQFSMLLTNYSLILIDKVTQLGTDFRNKHKKVIILSIKESLSSSLLSSFQRYGEISSHLYSPTSIFLYFFSIFPYFHNLYILSNLVYPSGSGSFPSIIVCGIFLGILFPLTCITCSNHLNLLFWMSFFISPPLFPILC